MFIWYDTVSIFDLKSGSCRETPSLAVSKCPWALLRLTNKHTIAPLFSPHKNKNAILQFCRCQTCLFCLCIDFLQSCHHHEIVLVISYCFSFVCHCFYKITTSRFSGTTTKTQIKIFQKTESTVTNRM